MSPVSARTPANEESSSSAWNPRIYADVSAFTVFVAAAIAIAIAIELPPPIAAARAAAAVSTTIELLFRAITVTDDATTSSLADAA